MLSRAFNKRFSYLLFLFVLCFHALSFHYCKRLIFIPRIHKKSIHSFIPTPHQTAKVDNSEINLPIITPKCFSIKVLSKYIFLNWKIKNCVPAFFSRQGEALLFRLHQPKISVCDSLLGQEVRRHFFVVE